MKKSVILASMMASFLMSGAAFAAGKASKEQQDDAEYMMRKIVEDIHARKLRTTVTDTTLDKSIQVVGAPVKFMDKKHVQYSKEVFACAHVSLKTKIRNGKKIVHQVKRTDELCKGIKSGKVLYVAGIH